MSFNGTFIVFPSNKMSRFARLKSAYMNERRRFPEAGAKISRVRSDELREA